LFVYLYLFNCLNSDDFVKCFEMMETYSGAPNWTIIFCSLHNNQVESIYSLAHTRGYKVHSMPWVKLNLLGKSHSGGCSQPRAHKDILIVFKHDDNVSSNNLDKHYSLLLRQKTLEVNFSSSCFNIYFLQSYIQLSYRMHKQHLPTGNVFLLIWRRIHIALSPSILH